jgi:ABC-2 type transport system permease protein
MFRMLLRKYAHESLPLWLACGCMLFVFPWVRIWTVSQFDLAGFAPLLDQIRALQRFSPVPLEQFLTYEGVVGLTFDEPILILCILVWSISRGSDVVSGELGRGTMEMLMAQPTSRLQVISAHALVTIFGLMGLVFMASLGMHMGIQTNSVPMSVAADSIQIPGIPFSIRNPFGDAPQKVFKPLSELIAIDLFIPSFLNLFGLGMTVLGLSVFYSSFDQYRWRTIGLTIGTYVLQLLLFVLARSTAWLGFLKQFTFLAAYQPDWIIQTGKQQPEHAWSLIIWNADGWMVGPTGFISILLLLGSTLYLIGIWRFLRRDLPAPL